MDRRPPARRDGVARAQPPEADGPGEGPAGSEGDRLARAGLRWPGRVASRGREDRAVHGGTRLPPCLHRAHAPDDDQAREGGPLPRPDAGRRRRRPLLERALAVRAGIGFLAKSSGVIHPRLGPWLLLGEILVAADVQADAPSPGSCGTCRACLDACPTGAITAPYSSPTTSAFPTPPSSSGDRSRPSCGRSRATGCSDATSASRSVRSRTADGSPCLRPRSGHATCGTIRS